jgi:GNAT superfamily N-acetyltransferase
VNVHYRISRGQAADIPAIAALLVRTWQQSYQGFLPASFLENMDIPKQEERHRRYLASGTVYRVVKNGQGTVCGFASYGPGRSEYLEADMELYTLYVRPEDQGQGLGKRLLDAVFEDLRDNHDSIAVSVMKRNPFLRFYLRNGFVITHEESIDFGDFCEEGLVLCRELKETKE